MLSFSEYVALPKCVKFCSVLQDMHRQIVNERETQQLLEELRDSKQRIVEVENTLNGQIGLLGMCGELFTY